MKVDILELYKSIFQAQGIHFTLLDEKFSICPDQNTWRMYQEEQIRQFAEEIREHVDRQEVVLYSDAFSVSYCVFRLTKELRKEYSAEYVVIGPVLFQVMEHKELLEVLNRSKVEFARIEDLAAYYNGLPKLPSRDFWISLLTPFIRTLLGEQEEFCFFDFQDEKTDQLLPSKLTQEESKIAFDLIQERYDLESAMMEAVCRGDRAGAICCYEKLRRFKFMPRTSDEIRNRKNWAIVLNTSLRKSVGLARVHPYYLDQLSTEFAIRIESANDETKLERLMDTMIKRYCLLVHNHSIGSYSAVVAKTIEYIKFHYTEGITLDQLAENCSVSTTYLSSVFRKETSVTITDYINSIRIEHAIFLLNSGGDSIMEIATKSGYNDANYFSRMFKRMKGITPNEYRKKIHRTKIKKV